MNLYLEKLKSQKMPPNFWCSEEYFQKAGWETSVSGRYVHVFTEEGILALPPLSINGELSHLCPEKEVWSDLEGYSPVNGSREFLDYEYLYDPKSFLSMEGKNWAVFRKNVRKFPRRIGEDLSYEALRGNDFLEELFSDWIGQIQENLIEDAEVMLQYLFSGENRFGLYGKESGKLYGLNIWDENYAYLNYRYSICLPLPFLSEYMRWLFYVETAAPRKKLVNDGGVLGKESLKIFKDKLNPVSVREVYSWKKS